MVKCFCSWLCRGSVIWVIQRVSALVMIFYFSPILYFWLSCPNLGYMWWSEFLTSNFMLFALFINIVMFFLHAFIGIWTVLTDYVQHKLFRNLLL